MNIWKTIVGLILTGVLCQSGYAQFDQCEQQLNSATDEFNAGRFYGIPGMLKGCIDRGFSREQRQRAFLLLTQVYLLLDDPIGAEDSYLNVLRANPEYETNPDVDPIDVVYLSRKFTASPIFSVYGRVGGNTSIVRVLHEVSPYSGPVAVDTKYSLQGGYQVAVGLDWNINEYLALNGEFSFLATSYRKTQTQRFGLDVEEFVDRQKWFQVPVSVKYMDHIGRFRPYGFAGYALNFLTTDNGEILIKNQNLSPNPGESNTITEAQSPTLDFTDQRRKLTYSLFVGGGVRYKWKLDYLFAEMRYSFAMNRIVDETKVYNSPNVFQYGHVDDYFRLDQWSVSVGFVRPLYKPRKLKKARTRGLLKLLNKKRDAVPEN